MPGALLSRPFHPLIACQRNPIPARPLHRSSQMQARTTVYRRHGTSRLLQRRVRDPDLDARLAALHAQTTAEAGPAAGHPVLEAINDCTKFVVSLVALFTLLLNWHELEFAWAVLGSILAAFACRGLKVAINEARPPAARKADPGMPSSHANSLSFLATYIAAATVAAAGGQLRAATASTEGRLLVVGIPLLGMFLTWLRVALDYHTGPQVVAGWLLGGSFAGGWCFLGHSLALPFLVFHPAEQWRLYGATVGAIFVFARQMLERQGGEAAAVVHAAPEAGRPEAADAGDSCTCGAEAHPHHHHHDDQQQPAVGEASEQEGVAAGEGGEQS